MTWSESIPADRTTTGADVSCLLCRDALILTGTTEADRVAAWSEYGCDCPSAAAVRRSARSATTGGRDGSGHQFGGEGTHTFPAESPLDRVVGVVLLAASPLLWLLIAAALIWRVWL